VRPAAGFIYSLPVPTGAKPTTACQRWAVERCA